MDVRLFLVGPVISLRGRDLACLCPDLRFSSRGSAAPGADPGPPLRLPGEAGRRAGDLSPRSPLLVVSPWAGLRPAACHDRRSQPGGPASPGTDPGFFLIR
ncbi:hypothetical protein NDU88_002485 [Pleurodeles waltl]|uniref:Uncharacterized protein n=1 Tax=Pleurodeles waltl TaxID=8319 RepID=A0AAV7VCQ9_PLEWA|nr:hypothetical protein NDU88_002485 [Pleurodeles waltl]